MGQKLTFQSKLNLAFGAAMGLALVLGVLCLWSLNNSKARFEDAVNHTVRKLAVVDQLNEVQSDLMTQQTLVLQYAAAKDAAHRDEARRNFQDGAAKYRQALATLRPTVANSNVTGIADNMESQFSGWMTEYAGIERLCEGGQIDEASKAGSRTLTVYQDLERQAEQLAGLQQEDLARELKANAEATSAQTWISVLLMAGMVVASAAAFVVIRNVSGALLRMAGQLSEGATEVANAAEQVSSSSHAVAEGSTRQAATLEETSASTEEINSMARKNTENSKAAAEFMKEASRRITEANSNLGQMMTSMKEINTSSDKIAKIIRVIDEIAFQTNILALNAAVEAARAGEAGMGFAVVADEVRNLAQRCAQAARDTAALIEESIGRSTEGKLKLDQVASAIQGVTESSAQVKTLVDEVSVGSQEQARGVDQIARAVAQMEQVTQKTAANAEEGASAGAELQAQAQAVRDVIGQLYQMVSSSQAEPASAVRVRQPVRAAMRTAVAPAAAPARASLAAAAEVKALPPPHRSIDKSEFPLDDDFTTF